MVDVILTAFCALTLLVLAFAKCGAGSKEEEIFDTLLLIARNVLQFGRLAAVMRQYALIVTWLPDSVLTKTKQVRTVDLLSPETNRYQCGPEGGVRDGAGCGNG